MPEILSTLRWFAEEMPSLAVIATGSLLDFALAQFEFSLPVGRISYLYLEPFSFDEFLLSLYYEGIYNLIREYQFNTDMPQILHNQLIGLFKEYIFVGELPAVVDCWKSQQSTQEVNKIHNEIVVTCQEDFNKYRRRVAVERLHETIVVIKLVTVTLVCSVALYVCQNPNRRNRPTNPSLSIKILSTR